MHTCLRLVILFATSTGAFAACADDVALGRMILVEQVRPAANTLQQREDLAAFAGVQVIAPGQGEVDVWKLPDGIDFNLLQRQVVTGDYPFRIIALTTKPETLARSRGQTQLPGFTEPARRLEFSKLDVFRPMVSGVSVHQAEAVSRGTSTFQIYKVTAAIPLDADSVVRPVPMESTYRIELSDTESMRLALTSISTVDEEKIRASFRWLDGDGDVFLERADDTVSGSIRRNGDVFAVITTASGETVAQPMPRLSDTIHPSPQSDVVPCSDGAFSNVVGNPEFVAAKPLAVGAVKDLKVLFVATRELQAMVPLPVLTKLAEQSLLGLDNQFGLQSIPLKAISAAPGVVGIDYSEACNDFAFGCWRRICRDVVRANGEMQRVHDLRNQLKADIVIVLVARIDVRGISADIGAPATHGFIVMAYNTLGGWETAAHEIAHLAGAYHHPNCGATVTIPGRHGYRSADGQRSTLEAGVCSNPIPRVQPMWSDPAERMLGGYPGGDTCCNTSGLLRGAAARLAGFR